MEVQQPCRRRWHHPEEFKRAVIEACCEPGGSVAGVALANGVNANQVRRWMRERGIEPPRYLSYINQIQVSGGLEQLHSSYFTVEFAIDVAFYQLHSL